MRNIHGRRGRWLPWALGAWCAAVLILPHVVYGVARATGALPSRTAWEAQGGRHGPWHSSQVLCSHSDALRMLAVSQGLVTARDPSEQERVAHRACRLKVAFRSVAEHVYLGAWFSLPFAGFSLIALLWARGLLAGPRALISAGVILALCAAAWALQIATLGWAFHY